MVGPTARSDVNMVGVAWRVVIDGRRVGELNGVTGVWGEGAKRKDGAGEHGGEVFEDGASKAPLVFKESVRVLVVHRSL